MNFTLVRLFFVLLVVLAGWFHRHLDVKCAYLYGDLSEESYMEQPTGFVADGNTEKVWKLKKTIYGLHQSGRNWYLELDKTLS